MTAITNNELQNIMPVRARKQPVVKFKVGRNDPCPCDAREEIKNPNGTVSYGKTIKYKKHCLPKEQGFIFIDGAWVSKREIDAKIDEKTSKIQAVKSEWN